MSGNNVTKSSMAQRVQNLIMGTQKHPPTGSLTIGGKSFTSASLVQVLQSLADALSAVDVAKANWKGALQKLEETRTAVGPIVSAYQGWVLATYGNAPTSLADYGMTPRKVRTPPSTEQTAQAIAKRQATRVARHTMGTQQKKDVKGTITKIVPAAPSVATAPIASNSVAIAPSQGTVAAGVSTPHAG
jgi:hypothetical protein